MEIRAKLLKKKQAETFRTETPPIPKMKLGLASARARSRRNKTSGFETIQSLLEAFGEFTLIARSDGSIKQIWSARQSANEGRDFPKSNPRAILHPRLWYLVQQMARQTAQSGQREESQVQVLTDGALRWFFVFAAPLGSGNGSAERSICLVARDVTERKRTRLELEKREALLEQAEQIANFGSWEVNLATHEVELSPQMRKIFGLGSSDPWSTDLYWARIHEGDREQARAKVEGHKAAGKPFQYVARYCTPEGRERRHLVRGMPFKSASGQNERAIGVVKDVTEYAESREKLERLSQQLLNNQDHHRRAIARELHESAGQSLAALKMTLGRLRSALPQDAKVAAALLDSATQLADGAVREVRTVTYLLHPPLLDEAGLGPALRWYSKGFSERSGIRSILKISDPFDRYAQEVETTVFRVVQEALTNVHRYSGSESVEMRLEQKGPYLLLEICDRGCGLPVPEEPTGRLGVGISGMSERVKQLNGRFEIDGIPGQGTTIRARLPVKPLKAQRKAETGGQCTECLVPRRAHARQG